MKQNNKHIIAYDREADVLAIYLHRGSEEEFVEIAPNIVGELDKSGALIGVEILNASKVLKPLLKGTTRTVSRAPAYAA